MRRCSSERGGEEKRRLTRRRGDAEEKKTPIYPNAYANARQVLKKWVNEMGAKGEKREFRCPHCGRESCVVRKPVYDDSFTKTGETLSCAMCRKEFASEAEIPYKDRGGPKVFTEDDRPRPVKVFEEGENAQMCRYCAEYVVNPFWQRCGLHKCEVEATDTCPHFRAKGG